ncbi:MAG TPA: hypothetical protein DDX92_02390 [Flavobacteriales bacterium]|nr:hypothetical protein [Flavobacteriales bacterium]
MSNDPCSWDHYQVEMRVIEIRFDSASNSGEIFLDFNKSSLAEAPRKMSELKDVVVDREFIELNSIKEGNIYTGVVSELTDGNCEERIVSFDQKLVGKKAK